ncbi:hypothetical protein [Hymenobacter sp. 102]|uniref:hypothetical protein n=1 Tax=Hymenobacter sp. 102 TaxID=3403152 RepID=UPI003CF68372
MMTLSLPEFMALPPQQQSEYILEYGQYLTSRRQAGYGINLYWLHSFFCELRVQQDTLELSPGRPFTSAGELTAYLPYLPLPEG